VVSRRDFLFSLPLAASLPGLLRAAAVAGNPVACQANAWQIKPGDFAELMRRAADIKRLGFVGFECNVRYVEGQFDRAAEVRAQFLQMGLRFYGPHLGLRFAIDELKRRVDGAASLGAERFVVSGAGAVLVKDGRLDEEALDKKVGALGQLGKHCRQAGLRLVYHNHTNEFEADRAEIEALLDRTAPECVSLLFDVGHAYRVKADPAAFLARHHGRIDALHLRDIRDGQQVPLGQGELDFAALAAVIAKNAWPGWLILEEEGLFKSHDAAQIELILQADRGEIRKVFGV